MPKTRRRLVVNPATDGIDVRLRSWLADVAAWCEAEPSIRALALVGSHARGAARPDSDIDLIILAEALEPLLADPSWTTRFGPVARQLVEDWGRVTSLRVFYEDGKEVEFSLARPDWASAPDHGSRRVASDGLIPLWDPEARFDQLR